MASPSEQRNATIYAARKAGRSFQSLADEYSVSRVRIRQIIERYRQKLLPILTAPHTTCRRGHPFNAENTYVYETTSGKVTRMCRACRRDRKKAKP